MAISNNYDVIILGAGGAGLMCALTASQRGRRVLVIDHATGPGKKILISGGGRCNFTNVNATTVHAQERYLSANPHFSKSALGRYTPQDFIALVRSYGIAFHEKTLGQLFCDGSARQIVEMLMEECDRSHTLGGRVDFAFNSPVGEISHDGSVYHVMYNGLRASAASLVIATGGPSIPKMGATAFAYDLGRQFGLKIVEPRPALVPLTLGGDDVLFRELSGVSAEVVAQHGKTAFREAALFTHRGLSGPAVLQISSYWRPGDRVGIDFLPDHDAPAWLLSEKRARPKATLKSTLDRVLSARLAEALADKLALQGTASWQKRAHCSIVGHSCPMAVRAMPRRRLHLAGSVPTAFRSRQWKPKKCRGFIASARLLMSLAGWVAITSNGHGRAASLRVKQFKHPKLQVYPWYESRSSTFSAFLCTQIEIPAFSGR
jgi:predicted Rossmann fold flavoprotein